MTLSVAPPCMFVVAVLLVPTPPACAVQLVCKVEWALHAPLLLKHAVSMWLCVLVFLACSKIVLCLAASELKDTK